MLGKLLTCGTMLSMLVAACSSDGGGGPSTPEDPNPTMANVTTSGTPPPRFIPSTVTVAPGGTVTWENTSPAPNLHNVVWASQAFAQSQDLEAGDTFEVTFPQAGRFDYQCLIHAGMTGQVVVE